MMVKSGRPKINPEDFAELKVQMIQKMLDEAKDMPDDELIETTKEAFAMKGYDKVARYLTAMYAQREYILITDFRTDAIKAYGDKHYFEDIGAELIGKLLTDTISHNNTSTTTKEVLHLLRTQTYKYDEDIKKAAPLNLLPFQNCIYDLENDQTYPHDPKFLFQYQVPVIYNPSADCPKIKQFLSEIVNAEDIPLLYDIFALALYRVNFLDKFFVLTGVGSNGKSKFLTLLEMFIGIDNCSNISLKQLTEDKFSVARTYGKLVNIGADIGQGVVDDTSTLKSASSSDRISGQFKFGQIFDFIPSATQIFSANNPPRFADDSAGMYRRAEIILFPNSFGNDKDMAENPNCKKADPKIIEKLTTPEELSGLLNIALQHLKNILKSGQLSVVKSTNELRNNYVKYSNSVQAFVESCLEECEYIPSDKCGIDNIEAQGFLFVSEMYPKYCDFCEKQKLVKKTKDAFSKMLKGLTEYNLEFGSKDWRGSPNEKQRSVRGIKFKEVVNNG